MAFEIKVPLPKGVNIDNLQVCNDNPRIVKILVVKISDIKSDNPFTLKRKYGENKRAVEVYNFKNN